MMIIAVQCLNISSSMIYKHSQNNRDQLLFNKPSLIYQLFPQNLTDPHQVVE